MYETFYHLSANPFRLTPDPNFCFSHSGYAEARAYLQYAFELGEGFILLTGHPGAGKTTLVESFLKELKVGNVAAARVAIANLDAIDLLRSVAFAFDIEAEGLDKSTLVRRVTQHFSALMHRGRRVLLVIDEAQGLSHSALEELRLLADLQEGASPLLQIFLVGQETLRSLMHEPGMEQLQQRVIGTCRLGPMGLVETKDYIRHRLCQAGWTGDPELTGAAVLAIFQYSGGVPRHINKICTRLLLQGFLESRHILDRNDVLAIAGELDEEQIGPARDERNSLDEAAGDATCVPVLPGGSTSLSELAVRVVQRVNATPSSAAPSAAGKRVEISISRGGPALAENAQVAVPRPPPREYTRPRAPPIEHSGFSVVPYTHNIPVARVLPGLRKLHDKPAILFGVLAVVTVVVATVTSYVENRSVEGRRSFVGDSQALQLQPGLSVTRGDESRETADSPGGYPGLWGRDGFAIWPGQPVHEWIDSVTPRKETDVDSTIQASRQSAPVAAAAVEVSPTVATDRGDSPTDSAEQPVDKEDGLSVQDDVGPDSLVVVESRSLVVPPDRLRSDDQAKVFAPTVLPDAGSPAVNAAATTDVASSVALVGPPRGSDSGQAFSGGQTEVPVVPVAERISALLLLAEEALREDRLLIPAQRSAYAYYQQVLSLEPGDRGALNGLGQIVERYIALAGRAVERQDEVKAKQYIARGLRVRPHDERLLALQDSMNAISLSVPPDGEDQAAAEPPPPPELAAPEAERARSFFQRLREFFSSGSSAPRDGFPQAPDSN